MLEELCDCGSDECPICFPEDDVELEMFALQYEAHEPEDDPMPNDLLPEPNEVPIESQKVNHANVSRLLKKFTAAVEYCHENPTYGKLHDIDTLTAIEMFMRMFVVHTVLVAAEMNPTTAVCNRTAVLKRIEELNDEILKLDLPSPQVN